MSSPVVSLRRFAEANACDEHDFHQIVLGLDGSMEMIVEGRGQRVDAHHAWLIPAGERHEYAGVGENRQLVLDMPPASLAVPERLFAQAHTLTLNDALTQLVREVAFNVARIDGAIAIDDTPARAPMCRFGWDAAARLAAALMASTGSDAPAIGLDFARIDRWLRAHLSEPLRVADLAAHCGFGLRRFHQLFEEAFGTTPHRYLQRLRLDTSLGLLRDARHSLTDIALEVGFADQSTYTHAFTRRFGLAPGQWRALRAH
nr:AraC family transcriptional regulator [Trinickia fusca]